MRKFPDAVAPIAPPPTPVDDKEVYVRHERERRAGICVFKRTQRRAAKEGAREAAAREIEHESERRAQERANLQAFLDEQWHQLNVNDRNTVFAAIEAAFGDNEMPAAVIDVQGDSARVLMKIGSPGELIPEREVTQTPTGRPTHKRRSKGVINELYAKIMASHIVATAKEAIPGAPGVDEVRVLAIRGERLGGGLQLIPLYAGQFDRPSLRRNDWKDVNVLGFIEAHGDINYRGQAQEVAALPTKGDPPLRAALDEIASHLEWKPAP